MGSTNYIGAYYVWRPAFGPASDPPVCFYAGGAYFDSDRWGDYSFTSVDPIDSNIFWTVQEYVTSGGIWGTAFGKVKRY
jgi:hypothetical protein